MIRRLRVGLGVALVCALAVAVAAPAAAQGPDDPAGVSVTLERRGPAVVAAGTVVELIATVTDALGAPVAGVQVRLQRTNLGTVRLDTCPDPAAGRCARTDETGQVRHLIEDDLDGHALIVATAYSDSGEALATSGPATIEFVPFQWPSCVSLMRTARMSCVPFLLVKGRDRGAVDVVVAKAFYPKRSKVALFRRVQGTWRQVGPATLLEPRGRKVFRVRDRHGAGMTKYKVRARTAHQLHWSHAARVR